MTAAATTVRDLEAGLDDIWERNHDHVLMLARVLQSAGAAVADGRFDGDCRDDARDAAHNLIGAADTFGFAHAGDTVRELQELLRTPRELTPGERARARQLGDSLRSQLPRQRR